jgi:Periplasmic component of the Tol biopolymer transport system
MKTRKILISLILILLPFKVYGLIEVDITRGNLNPLPIAVSALYSDDETTKALKKDIKVEQIGYEISLIIENNLKATGLFNPLEKKAFLQKPDVAHLKPRFEDWSLIKAQALITGKVEFKDDKVRVEFRLWDVLAAREMLALAFTTVPNNGEE